MPYYIKTRPYVKQLLRIAGFRAETKDGNVLLWQEDARKTGCVVLQDAAKAIGGVLLTPAQALAETNGEQSAELPMPADPRYAEPADAEEEPAGKSAGAVAEAEEEAKAEEEPQAQGETQAESQAQAESESEAEADAEEETQEQAGEGEAE